MTIEIPCTPENWSRVERAIAHLRCNDLPISEYWDARSSTFGYVRISSDRVSVSGYFDSPDRANSRDWVRRLVSLFRPATPDDRYHRAFNRELLPFLQSRHSGLLGQFEAHELAKPASLTLYLGEKVPYEKVRRIIEIGGGGCLLALMLLRFYPVDKYTIVDLPAIIPLGFLVLANFLDSSRMQLPGEKIEDPKVVWLLPSNDAQQAHIDPADLFINVTSFQEMERADVSSYFDLMERRLEPGGYFLCVNRVEKQIRPGVLSRFCEYPWPRSGFEIVDETVDRFASLSGHKRPIIRRLMRKMTSAAYEIPQNG